MDGYQRRISFPRFGEVKVRELHYDFVHQLTVDKSCNAPQIASISLFFWKEKRHETVVNIYLAYPVCSGKEQVVREAKTLREVREN